MKLNSKLEKILLVSLLTLIPIMPFVSRKLEAGSTTKIRTVYNFQYNFKPAAVKRAYRKLWPDYLFIDFKNGTKEKGFFLTDDEYKITLNSNVFYVEPYLLEMPE